MFLTSESVIHVLIEIPIVKQIYIKKKHFFYIFLLFPCYRVNIKCMLIMLNMLKSYLLFHITTRLKYLYKTRMLVYSYCHSNTNNS